MTALLSTDNPLLPGLELLRWARRLGWGMVLAGLAIWLTRRWPRPLRLGLAGFMWVWALLPGPGSPSFWLGLAFQSPSLMACVLLVGWSLMTLWPERVRRPDLEQERALWRASLGLVLLGWGLLLDSFALFPFSLYAFGFSPAAVGAVALVAVLPWVFAGARQAWGVVGALLMGVLLLQVGLRLPSGNVWDALLDPGLWLGLQVAGVCRFSALWRARSTTRA